MNGHADPLTYAMSTNAEDISSWSEPVLIGDNHYYATLDIDADNKLNVVTRDSAIKCR